jgi:hypothetical protein
MEGESSTKVADRYADQIGNALHYASSYTHPYSRPNVHHYTYPNADIDSTTQADP